MVADSLSVLISKTTPQNPSNNGSIKLYIFYQTLWVSLFLNQLHKTRASKDAPQQGIEVYSGYYYAR